MLDRILNKKIRVGVAFNTTSYGVHDVTASTGYCEGVAVAYDDNFLVFEDNSMIGIKYIQTIQIIK